MTNTVGATPPGARPRPARARPTARRGVLSSGRARGAGLLVAVAVLVGVAFGSLAFGAKPVPLTTVFDGVFHFDGSNDHLIVRSLRGPRTVIGLLVGASLGMAGGVMQGVTRNPLADPGILGVQAGASLAVVVSIHSFSVGSVQGHVWFALVGAALASAVVYTLGSVGRGGATPVKLALAGAALSALLMALTSAVLLLDVTTLDQFRFWVVGSLAGRDGGVATSVTPFLAAGALLAAVSSRPLNALALGDDVARSLGQRIGLSRAVAAGAVVLLCGGATAAAGPITFVGLTVPHVARAISGPDYRWILPWSAVLAPILLLGADIVGRVVARPGELQVGIVTALLGAPFFIALVRRRRLAML